MKWIPITTKEPEVFKSVLVTWEFAGKRYVTTASRRLRDGVSYWEADSAYLFRYTPLNVIAWAEYPAPYKGD